MSFNFKELSRDFIVTEQLPFELSWHGDAFYVLIEKRNITTHDVLKYLRKKLWLSRMSIWIAWLKDKKAIAKQWISIYNRALNKAWGEKVFLSCLEEIVKIKEVNRHEFPLNLSTPIRNHFEIKLRATKKLWQEMLDNAKNKVSSLLNNWYPNYFWTQRFWIMWRNIKQGKELLLWTSQETFTQSEAKFKLQAYVSKLYNDFVTKRIASKNFLLDGDILTWMHWSQQLYWIYYKDQNLVKECLVKNHDKTPFFPPTLTWEEYTYSSHMTTTWPVLWFNLLRSDWATEAWIFEKEWLVASKIWTQEIAFFQEYWLFWLRRSIRVYPQDYSVETHKSNLLISFSLPSWSYASNLFDLFKVALKKDEVQ